MDGTKEFITRNGEFTVNIALCSLGKPTFGIIYAPISKELYVGNVNDKKSFKRIIDPKLPVTFGGFTDADRIFPNKRYNGTYKVVGSRSHMNLETEDFVKHLKGKYGEVEVVSKGSSLKFCLVAEGKADVYPRFAPTMEWDTAAGHAICKAVGLRIIDQTTGKELCYNKENLLNNYFLVSSDEKGIV